LLYHAIYHTNLEAVKILIEMNADVNNIDANGDPLVFYSVINGLIEFSDLIIGSDNFDVNKPNTSNESLLEVCIVKNTIFGVQHSILILGKRPNVFKDKRKIQYLMSVSIEKQNTIIAFKLYNHYLATIIQHSLKRKIKMKNKM
jgi:ankyrin repeat protein